MSQRVLVTGAAGHLGRAVVTTLCEAGFDVVAADQTYNRDLPVRTRVLDLRDALSIYGVIDGCEAVAHLANHSSPFSHPSPQQLYADNVAMDIHVFQAARDVGVRKLIFASSVQAFAGDRYGDDAESKPSVLPYIPLDGDLPTCPRNTYALSKEAGEAQLRYFVALDPELSCTSLRFPSLLSERWLHYIRTGRARRFRGGRDRFGSPDEGFSYLTTDDAARLVQAILEKQGPGYHQLLPATSDALQQTPAAELVPRYYPGVPLRVPLEEMKSLIDISKITEALGWEPKDTGLFADMGE
jgi:nucleoside-diphosphate-sugar epimerase